MSLPGFNIGVDACLPPLPGCVADSDSGWHCGWDVDEAWIDFSLAARGSKTVCAPTLRARLETLASYLSTYVGYEVHGVFVADGRKARGQPFMAVCSTIPAESFLKRPTRDQLEEFGRVFCCVDFEEKMRWAQGIDMPKAEEDEGAMVEPLTPRSSSEFENGERGPGVKRWSSLRRKFAMSRMSSSDETSS
ncbi:hypothetical protein K523DRAFT_350210 [Schizophyllum commune Tattone D]|nr:hypothetical protein K523DRAFT_350210 [Schizophyllum commune Tattone D]